MIQGFKVPCPAFRRRPRKRRESSKPPRLGHANFAKVSTFLPRPFPAAAAGVSPRPFWNQRPRQVVARSRSELQHPPGRVSAGFRAPGFFVQDMASQRKPPHPAPEQPTTRWRDDAFSVYGGDGFWDVPHLAGDNESKFIERLRAQDERAFNELVITYEHRVFRLVYRMLGRREESRDMAQEVFVQVFKAIGQFRGDAKLSTWIYRIAVNLCKNRLKYLARRCDAAQDELEPVADRAPLHQAKGVTLSDVSRPDHLVEGFQLEQLVRRCIAELDPDFREVLVLRDVEDLTYEEIAEITGLADGTVKSRIHRARSMLKTMVEHAMGERIG